MTAPARPGAVAVATNGKWHAPLACPRCGRANPPEARFCYFDGVNLAGTGTGLVGSSDLGRDFLFPSGRRCRTFDQLLQACSEDWGSAKALFRQGTLRQFLASIGRADLAVAADRAAAQSDLDLGLDQLLAQFPVSEEQRPKLDLAPRRLHLPGLHAGESREFTLTIVNQGARLLHGELRIDGDAWIRPAGASQQGSTVLPIKAGKKQQFSFEINTAGLPAGQRYAGKLTLVTSGGAAEVPISVDVVPIPFAQPPLLGAATPRELAAGMKEIPKQVYPLLENGVIRDWFSKNGWQYPVTGPATRGIAAVQQFFEALGLSKPPPLEITPQRIELTTASVPQPRVEIALASPVKKWLFARVSANKPWVVVPEQEPTGAQRIVISLELQTRRLAPGQTHEALVSVEANGGQTFSVPIRLALVQRPFAAGGRLLVLILVGMLTGLALRLAAVPFDWLARLWAEEGGTYVRHFSLLLAWLGMALFAALVSRRRKWKLLPAALLVGGVSGLLVAASVANLLQVVDGFAAASLGAWGFPSWLSITSVWLGLGLAGTVLLRVAGTWGEETLASWQRLLAQGCQRLGLRWLAGQLAP